MKKKQITKLFAVMAMAASPAAANPVGPPDLWAGSATASLLSPEQTSVAFSAMFERGFAAIARRGPEAIPALVAARPRTTPSGAPACGNVASRAPRRECAVPAVPILASAPTPAPVVATTPIAARTPAPTTQGAK